MLEICSGCDLVHLPEFERHNHPRFQERAYADSELSEAGGRVESLAARWAAKEAAYKAFSQLAAQLQLDAEGLAVFRDYQVSGQRPRLVLSGRPAALVDELKRGGRAVSIGLSLTHDGDYAAAFVVIGVTG
jgi:holo-[acyl-carrier protein] synthase